MASTAQALGQVFRQAGYSRAGAAGIIGNLQQESSLNPNAPGGGLAQWIGSRYTALQQYAAQQGRPVNDPMVQASFLVNEIRTQYPGLNQYLRTTSDPRQAALAVSQQYERPGVPMNANRESYAVNAFQQLGGGPVGGGPADVSFPSAGGAGGAAFARLTASQNLSLPQTQQVFDQAGYQQAKNQFIVGQALRQSEGSSNPFNATPGATKGFGDSLGSGSLSSLLPKQAPNPQDFRSLQTTMRNVTVAQSELQKLAGDVQLQPHPGTTAAISAANLPKGLTQFDGKPVAAWIAPVLKWAQQHGWQGTVNSGYRTLAQQTAIYNSGVRPAAKPGTSNHEMTAFPGGAVDVTDAQQLSTILARSPYASLLVWAGAKDPVHFSHPHNGSY